MKTVFILKLTYLSKVGYYDGATNWAESLSEAKHFATYPEAEAFIKDMIENHGWGGMIQIEKYFTAP
jgi:hypothetical protein